MIRQLLAVLALITGLIAVAEPVQAARPGASVETASQAEQGSPCRRARVVLQLDEEPRRGRDMRERGCLPSARAAVAVPSVQLQADRARE